MITVIKEGKIPRYRYFYETDCKNCKTVFTCDHEDFYGDDGNGWGDTRCPLCNNLIPFKNFKRKEELIHEIED
jgi:predicted Zn finger-like uncharacterized protein